MYKCIKKKIIGPSGHISYQQTCFKCNETCEKAIDHLNMAV